MLYIKKNRQQLLALKNQSPQNRNRPLLKQPRLLFSNYTTEKKLYQEVASDLFLILDLE